MEHRSANHENKFVSIFNCATFRSRPPCNEKFIMLKIIILILLRVVMNVDSQPYPRCTPVVASLCLASDSSSAADFLPWPYNYTTYPTFAGEQSEYEVRESLAFLHQFVSTECSRYIKLFLCAVHSPVCTDRGVVPPCRELCDKVRSDCKVISKMFGIQWPTNFDCHHFPSIARSTGTTSLQEEQGYVGEANSMLLVRRASSPWSEALLDNGKVCIPASGDDVVTPVLRKLADAPSKDEHQGTGIKEINPNSFTVTCPADLKSPPGHMGYNFLTLENCTAPCPNMYLDKEELVAVRSYVCALSIVCLFVTSFVLLTFAIDTKRFCYPERPILFYALSYFVVSVVFLVGFSLGEQASCNDKIVNEENEVIQGYALVKGAHRRICTLLFMLLYYFIVNGAIWWLILTITWLLAAGFKWGSEAIEKHWLIYHAVAWTLPVFQTMVVIVFNKVEGDNVSGVCFVGIHDSNGLKYFLLLPMCLYLLVGVTVLLAGFICLNRVRKSLENDEENKEKLAKFMLRIGVFSVLFIVPQIGLIILYVVEDINRHQWTNAWYIESCTKYAVPCPSLVDPQNQPVSNFKVGTKPSATLFIVKYTLMLIVALPPLFWVASKKTINSWSRFFNTSYCSTNTSAMNTTQTRLLDDSNGPHARDRDANLTVKVENHKDVVFNEFRDSGLHGSSASVAAARSINARQQKCEKLSDAFSSDSTSSLMRAIEKDKTGERVKGRGRKFRRNYNDSNRTDVYLSRCTDNTDQVVVPPKLEDIDGVSFPTISSMEANRERTNVRLQNDTDKETSQLNRIRKPAVSNRSKGAEDRSDETSCDANQLSNAEEQPKPVGIENYKHRKVSSQSNTQDKLSGEPACVSNVKTRPRAPPPPPPTRVDSIAVTPE